MSKYEDKARKRFENSYMPEPNSGRWLWTGYVHNQGYGFFYYRGQKNLLAHRVSYEFYKGKIDIFSNVLHKCDTPCCVNPDHLFLGTQQTNVLDAISKGRFKMPPTQWGHK